MQPQRSVSPHRRATSTSPAPPTSNQTPTPQTTKTTTSQASTSRHPTTLSRSALLNRRAPTPPHDDAAATSAKAKGPRNAAPDRVLLRILGPLTLENTDGHARPGPTGRGAQLLTYLALHPRGRTIRQITADIWHADNPAGANRALVRLRQDLTTATTELAPDLAAHAGPGLQPVVREPHGTYHLNHELIHTDHADFTRLAIEADREKNPARRTELAAQALAHVHGELAEGVSDADQEWLTWAREELRTRARSLGRAAEGPVATVPLVAAATRKAV